MSLFHGAGCPSDGGCAGAAYDALIEATETDSGLRYEVAGHHGGRLKHGAHVCPNELPQYEALLAKWVRQEWEDGLLDRTKAAGPYPVGPVKRKP